MPRTRRPSNKKLMYHTNLPSLSFLRQFSMILQERRHREALDKIRADAFITIYHLLPLRRSCCALLTYIHIVSCEYYFHTQPTSTSRSQQRLQIATKCGRARSTISGRLLRRSPLPIPQVPNNSSVSVIVDVFFFSYIPIRGTKGSVGGREVKSLVRRRMQY